MIPLGEYIDTKLKALHSRSYHEQAPDGAEFPYVVYNFPNSLPDEIREDFVLTVDIWEKGTSTLTEEQLAGTISRDLHKDIYLGTDLAAIIFKENQLAIPDPDPDIRRRQLRFECRVYYL